MKEAVDKLQVSDQHYKIRITFFSVAVMVLLFYWLCMLNSFLL